MTTEKLVLIILAFIIFILSVSIYKKSVQGEKKFIFSSILGSSLLGALSLGTVLLLELFCGKLITLNICTILFSLLGSLPAVAAMLFINII